MTNDIRINKAVLNTVDATYWQLIIVLLLGKKVQLQDSFGVDVKLKRWQGKDYFMDSEED